MLFLKSKRKIGDYSSIILHEILLNYYLVGIFKESLCKFFAENVARGNSVQIGPDFPAKSLSIYTKEKF